MQIINQENQKLVSLVSESETIHDQDSFHNQVYKCNGCLSFAEHPVVTQCSHLYCWSCIPQGNNSKNGYCRVCSEVINKETLRPIFISSSNNQTNIDPSLIHSRPKGLNIEPIRNNSNLTGQQNQNYYLKNNIEIEKQVPGVCSLPCNLILLFNELDQNYQENGQRRLNKDIKDVVEFTQKLQKCLLISLVLIILGILCLSFSF